MRVNFGSLVVPVLLLVGGMGSSAHAQHLVNGGFNNAKTPGESWKVQGQSNEVQFVPGVIGNCVWLNDSGAEEHDPSVSQDMTNLTVGKTYVIAGQYKIGAHALDPTKGNAKPGDKMLAIDIDGVVKTTVVAPSEVKDATKLAGSTWLQFGVSFKATKNVHNLRIRGEIEGKDADVYVDEVSVSPEPDASIILNGSFDTKPSEKDWKLEHIEEGWNRYKTETLKDMTTNGFFWLNGLGDHKDPAVVQTMKNLKPGKTYIISCQYRTGAKAEEFGAKPGTPMLAISVDGKEMNRGFAASAKGDATKIDHVSWSSLNTTFVATKTEHELKIRGEIDGHDGDVDLDNVSVVETEAIAGSNAAASAESNAQSATKKVTVQANVVSVDTKEKLEVGDIVEVTEVTGKVYMNKPAKPENATGMEGWTQFKPTDTCLFANATPASLVGYIGDPKSHYQVRKSQYVEAKTAGNLFFAVNDQPASYADNSGEFVVSYKIIKKDFIRSKDLGGKLNINWVNKTGVPITVNWIDQKGKEMPSSNGIIQPDKIFDGVTHVGHIFRVRDDKNAEICLIEVEATSEKVNIQK